MPILAALLAAVAVASPIDESPEAANARTLERAPGASQVSPDAPVVLPTPDSLGYARLWAGPTASWRNQAITGPRASGRAVDLSSPYAGFELGAEWLPFSFGDGRRAGFLVDYQYGTLKLRSEGFAESRAADHRFVAELLGRSGDGAWGRFGLHLGVSYKALLTSEGSPLAESTHLSPRVGLDWSRPIVGPVGLYVEAGVEPVAYVGSALRGAYGEQVSSQGLDAAIGLQGPTGLTGLRWKAGYQYLRQEDAFGAEAGSTRQLESVHRVGLVLSYEP